MRRERVEIPAAGGEAPLAVDADVAETFAERARGLLIPRCNAIHTLFMRYPIDAVFLDRAGRVVRRVRGIRPWRFFVWGGWRAVQVLEISPGPI